MKTYTRTAKCCPFLWDSNKHKITLISQKRNYLCEYLQMKKNLFILSLFLLSVNIFGQNQPLYDVQSIHEMPVFPNCEKIKTTQKKKMSQCISQQLTQLMSAKLAGFEDYMNAQGMTEAQAKLRFIISKEGIIVGAEESQDSNVALADAAIDAIQQISNELQPIRPAKLKSGEIVNVQFEIPLKFMVELQKKAQETMHYPVDEIVLFSLLEKGFRYEIRLFKGKNLKVYEIKDDKETFLGNFLSLQEIGQSDPYKTLIQNEKNSEMAFITDGYLDQEFFEIYIRHLFDQKKNAFIEIYQVKDDKKTKVAEYLHEIDFNQSRYAPLIYRE